MKILICGSSGLVGSALCDSLKAEDHVVWRLVRHHPADKEIQWNPAAGDIDTSALEGFDAVINLTGESIVKRPWSESVKQAILDSRVQSTQLLSKALAQLVSPPNVLINASATGYYGDCGEQICTESSPKGAGFLADVCRQWEDATGAAQLAKIRTVHARFGIILSQKGGALAKMLLPFKLGLGATLGNGEQYMSWITIDDLVAIIAKFLTDFKMSGPVNVVSPFPVTNKEFTKILGKVLNRPTFLSVPVGMLRFLAGKEMADEFFLASSRVKPQRLIDAGYPFLFPELEIALRHLLNNN